ASSSFSRPSRRAGASPAPGGSRTRTRRDGTASRPIRVRSGSSGWPRPMLRGRRGRGRPGVPFPAPATDRRVPPTELETGTALAYFAARGDTDMSTIERAIAIAAEAHTGQVDKAGAPYVLHPLRMMLRMASNDERIVAVLHDVCEDCPCWTMVRLRKEGFAEHLIEALRSVTKRDGEDYEAFVRRAAGNRIGRQVKLADLRVNCD